MKRIELTIQGGTRIDWAALAPHSAAARQIIAQFSEWATDHSSSRSLSALRDALPSLWEEACEVGQIVGADPMAVLAANCFYDLSIRRCGCTAFAVDLPSGPVHAHCLDWDYGTELLRNHVSLFTFAVEGASPRFFSVGWPGFLGVFVGVAPGRFAVSLNAVWSEDDRVGGEPVAFLLRRALATVSSFDQAVEAFNDARVASDCILLISGIERKQVAVVERTPARSAVRRLSQETLLATNHYCVLEAGSNAQGYTPTGYEPVGHGSLERYAAATERLWDSRPGSLESCFSLLNSPPFRQSITLQRVVMRAATGQILASPLWGGTVDRVAEHEPGPRTHDGH